MKWPYILLTISLASLLAWRLFSWFLSNDKVDLFLFYEFEQSPKWYAFYSANYLREILYQHVIVFLAAKVRIKGSRELKELAIILLIVSYLRLVIYWLFRGQLNLEVPVALIVLMAVYKLLRWQKFL